MNVKEEIMEVLDNEGYEYDSWAVTEIADEWAYRKANLLDMFRQHPAWNEDKLCIELPKVEYTRKFNKDAISKFKWWLVDNGAEDKGNLTGRQFIDIQYLLNAITDTYFNEDMKYYIDKLNDINDTLSLRTNMKSSKAIGKICRTFGWDKIEGYNTAYAEMCDNINPMKVNEHTVISLNPVDFLYMSKGDSWCSCHDIRDFMDPGCYSSGTISYMLDETSFVFYTVKETDIEEEIYYADKHKREIFAYKDGVVLQSRLYPQSCDTGADHAYEEIRNIVQKVLSDAIGRPNLWTVKKKDVSDYICKGRGATCYPDWEPRNPGSQHCTLSYLKGIDLDGFEMEVGAKPICIECGSRHSETENINCCASGKMICEHCGDRIEEWDAYWVEGYGYCCEDCCTRCDDCGEYVLNEDIRETEDGTYVCSGCAEDHYYECEYCGKLVNEDDVVFTYDDYPYCESCAEHKLFTCDECGEVFEKREGIEDEDGNWYCDKCYEEKESENETEAA